MKYGNWTIERNPKPIPTAQFDYDYWHDDHDGENGLCGCAASFDLAKEAIDDIEIELLESEI